MSDHKETNHTRVLVGMSGGVDSAVAALLLKEAGYEVIGATLRTWQAADGGEGRCCEIDDAARTARLLGIRHYAFNCMLPFREKVTDPFVRDYCRGLTPNPCVTCNREVKWEGLLHFAQVLGAAYIATGHYASVIRLANGRYTVRRAAFAPKDQSYMLWRLTQRQLQATLTPLGELSKAEVRALAAGAGLPVTDKSDSQELCFVPQGDYPGFIRENAAGPLPGEGWFVNERGEKLGRHRGLLCYTVGQRKGLGLSLPQPVYVSRIDVEKNEIVVGPEKALYRRTVLCDTVNYMGLPALTPGQILRADVKIRYRHAAVPALLRAEEDGRILISFDAPVKAPAPGQSAVFYDAEGCVLGGGRILRTAGL